MEVRERRRAQGTGEDGERDERRRGEGAPPSLKLRWTRDGAKERRCESRSIAETLT